MKPKNCLLLLLLICIESSISFVGQDITVSGRVVDTAGQGIAGVTVSVHVH